MLFFFFFFLIYQPSYGELFYLPTGCNLLLDNLSDSTVSHGAVRQTNAGTSCLSAGHQTLCFTLSGVRFFQKPFEFILAVIIGSSRWCRRAQKREAVYYVFNPPGLCLLKRFLPAEPFLQGRPAQEGRPRWAPDTDREITDPPQSISAGKSFVLVVKSTLAKSLQTRRYRK